MWAVESPDRLSEEARRHVRDRSNEVILSAASSWEIAIKYAIGKLPLPEPPDFLFHRTTDLGVVRLDLRHEHAMGVATLPLHHRDPFDRILVVQARIEGLTILTSDPAFDPYDVDVLHAG